MARKKRKVGVTREREARKVAEKEDKKRGGNDGRRCASHRFEDCFACVSNDTARNDGVGGERGDDGIRGGFLQ